MSIVLVVVVVLLGVHTGIDMHGSLDKPLLESSGIPTLIALSCGAMLCSLLAMNRANNFSLVQVRSLSQCCTH